MLKELHAVCKRGELIELAERYVESCRGDPSETVGRSRSAAGAKFPNLAGFARSLGVGVDSLKRIREVYPEQYGGIMTLFEDEALNALQTPAVITAYMKEHFGYGEKKEGRDASSGGVGRLQLVFEHDIVEDGG